ncbi:MAG TPA: TonB-dependent siderophore receptor [Longimicrobium sp.]|nr:TonB-dependent siderophore receptor [Longimicrobium sp.]
MRLTVLLGAGCLLCGTQAAAQAPRSTLSLSALAPIPGDTTASIRFNIPAQPLSDALRAFSRQAAVRVQLDVSAAAGVQSHAVTGALTAPEALRQLLAGTGLAAQFADGETAMVARGDSRIGGAYTLTPLTVVGSRSVGYATRRTTTATKTDTPLRDTPQSVSVVTGELIADQSMQSMADVVRYVPGITMGQGEGHRDAPTIRGNSSTADFFVDGVRDDAQYLRDLYNAERVEALKGSNAMIFGRGGGGGVINRVTKDAQWAPTRAFTLETGSYEHRRGTLDLGQGFGANVAARFNGVFEDSRGFRDEFGLRRYGLNPTLAVALGSRTTLRAGYEYFNDERTVDRGIPSFQGRPSGADIHTFFGNPDLSHSELEAQSANVFIEHGIGGLTIRNRSRWASYDKFYQNSFPGAVNADGTLVTLSAYNNATDRRNLFNQTDLNWSMNTAGVEHTLLAGAEIGRQESENFRNTGYYNDATTSVQAPFGSPTVTTPITFRQSATDADNQSTATVAGVYVQDQLELSRYLQAIVGLRFDRFDIDFHNNRTDEDLHRQDDLLSPRAGLILKPVEPVSLYGSYTVSYLPSSGDQFSSLTATTETLEPEQFTNYELGAKWDVLPGLALTSAIYRLDRTNTSAPDPNDPTRTVQTGEARTTGWELGASGSVTDAWQVTAGFSRQRAKIVEQTAAAPAGAQVPLVPRHTVSMWNRVQVLPSLGLGVGVLHQSKMFAAIDNTVTLPGFTRFDGAVFLRVTPGLSAQVNVENLFDEQYYATSHGNNNILPGAPRTVRFSLTTRR